MTKDEALKLALEYVELVQDDRYNAEHIDREVLVTAIKEALAQPEPVKIAHKHEWFRTGEMKIGQMRCISCGTWGQDEIPQRTWVGLTDDEIDYQAKKDDHGAYFALGALWAGAKLKEKNT
jgi:hypothetical protein